MIELKLLSDIKKPDIIDLMNHPLVQKHMPLAKSIFDEADYTAFLAAK